MASATRFRGQLSSKSHLSKNRQGKLAVSPHEFGHHRKMMASMYRDDSAWVAERLPRGRIIRGLSLEFAGFVRAIGNNQGTTNVRQMMYGTVAVGRPGVELRPLIDLR
jgi:hypothetical protein